MPEPSSIKARDIMNTFVVTVRPEDTAWTALELMNSHGVGALVVVEGNEAIGIVTERDILRSVLKKRGVEDLLSMLVKDVMSGDLVTCEPDTPLVEVLSKMVERNIRRVPVVSAGMLEGIITEWNCMKALLDLIKTREHKHESP
ncbi:MAG: CBS domain-containing protein [Nitrososphaerota archaeon]|nr:CBS domain-containing protein [Candidatus Calditenuaceae archaeon]MDW8072807.1 CBS domain-containing protein [Nitrososphaerota archaeon]